MTGSLEGHQGGHAGPPCPHASTHRGKWSLPTASWVHKGSAAALRARPVGKSHLRTAESLAWSSFSKLEDHWEFQKPYTGARAQSLKSRVVTQRCTEELPSPPGFHPPLTDCSPSQGDSIHSVSYIEETTRRPGSGRLVIPPIDLLLLGCDKLQPLLPGWVLLPFLVWAHADLQLQQ